MVKTIYLCLALFVVGISCIEDICYAGACGNNMCNADSFCWYDSTCICPYGYTTNFDKSQVQCCYKQKKQMWAFFLELMVTFGAGHFYLERYTFAAVKLAIMIAVIIIGITFYGFISFKRKLRLKYRVGYYTSIILLIAMLVAHLVDVVVWIRNKYKDGNGVDVMPW